MNRTTRRWGLGLTVAAGFAGAFAAGCANETIETDAASGTPTASAGNARVTSAAASSTKVATTTLSVYEGMT